jgi:hypothetical protein
VGGFGSGRLSKNVLESSFFRLKICDLNLGEKLTIGLEWRRDSKALSRAFISPKGSYLTIRLLEWHADGKFSDADETVQVRWTSCRLGGKRPWFICPLADCGRRVAILYGNCGLACRTCRGFSYPSQRIPPESRALARAQNLRIRLGGSVDISQPIPPKPKGMHTWTYTRLCLRLLRAESEANAELSSWLKSLNQRRRKPSTIKST